MIYGNEVDDRTLAAMAQAGDRLAESALVKRYSPLAEGLSRGYFLAGGDADDLKQIAMIALLEAVRSYDAGRGAEFSTYASVCVRSRLLDAVRAAGALKNSVLTDSIRLEADGEDNLLDIASDKLSPEQQYIEKEAEQAFFDALGAALGERGREVLRLYLASVPYKEISEKLGMSAKQVDNTLYHAKKKLARIIGALKKTD